VLASLGDNGAELLATQEAIARDAGITTATLSLIERGQANPTWDTLRKITAALGSSMGELGKFADKLEI